MKNKYSIFFKSAKYEEAIAICKEHLKTQPGDVQALVVQGDAYSRLQKYEDAKASYENAINIQKDYVEAYVHLGKILAKQGYYNKAIEYITQATVISPNYTYAYQKLADIYRKMGLPDEVNKYSEIAYAICEKEEDSSAVLATSPNNSPTKSSHLIDKSLSEDLGNRLILTESTNTEKLDSINEPTINTLRDNLFKAARENNVELIKQILAQGINIDIQDKHDMTALYIATLFNRYEAAEELLKAGANPNVHCMFGLTPMHSAAEHANQKILELLINYKGRLDVVQEVGGTLLHSAAIGIKNGHEDWSTIKWLLESNKIDPFTEDNTKDTARDILEQRDYSYAEIYDDILEGLGYYADSADDVI